MAVLTLQPSTPISSLPTTASMPTTIPTLPTSTESSLSNTSSSSTTLSLSTTISLSSTSSLSAISTKLLPASLSSKSLVTTRTKIFRARPVGSSVQRTFYLGLHGKRFNTIKEAKASMSTAQKTVGEKENLMKENVMSEKIKMARKAHFSRNRTIANLRKFSILNYHRTRTNSIQRNHEVNNRKRKLDVERKNDEDQNESVNDINSENRREKLRRIDAKIKENMAKGEKVTVGVKNDIECKGIRKLRTRSERRGVEVKRKTLMRSK